MTHPAEHIRSPHPRRRPIDIDAPTITTRVLADLAANPGTTSREMADRLALDIVSVSRSLGSLRDQGRARGVLVRGAYQWTKPGLAVALREVPPHPASVRALDRSAATRRAKAAAELAELSALLEKRHPRRTSIADACVALRWSEVRARYRMEALVRDGRAVGDFVNGRPGQWRPVRR